MGTSFPFWYIRISFLAVIRTNDNRSCCVTLKDLNMSEIPTIIKTESGYICALNIFENKLKMSTQKLCNLVHMAKLCNRSASVDSHLLRNMLCNFCTGLTNAGSISYPDSLNINTKVKLQLYITCDNLNYHQVALNSNI